MGKKLVGKKLVIRNRFGFIVLLLLAIMCVLSFTGFLIGRYEIAPRVVLGVLGLELFSKQAEYTTTVKTIVLDVRLPRILGAILVGGALSLAGASYQTLFKNPLVSPDILGVSAGAGFGAALAMLYFSQASTIGLSAFVFGIFSVMLSFVIARLFNSTNITLLVLAGIAIAGVFRALISILKYLADPIDTLPSITFWLMGSLSRISNIEVAYMALPIGMAVILLAIFRYRVDALSAGEDEAALLGVNVALIKAIIIIAATLLTASSVSVAGIVGFVGLLVPHLARLLAGASFARIIPISFLLGGIFLLIVDSIARGVGDSELPLGVLTTLVGAPAFILLLARVSKGSAC